MDSQAAPQPTATTQAVICEVCGTYFETRRGLSSHARLHLRQLGVTVSESSGAPIELLYQIFRERGSSFPDFKADSSEPEPATLNKTNLQASTTLLSSENQRTPNKAVDGVMTTPKKMDHQESPARLKETTPLPSSPSALRLSESSSLSPLEHQTSTNKPLWAPLETDAPITLDTKEEVYVCQLCGCWYETRKGLSSHARAHLRQIGIPDSNVKGSPVDFLYQIMAEEDLKPISRKPVTSDSPSCSTSKRALNMSSPPASSPSKRPKTSDNCTCILCGEVFENRKGLGSHARSHLRQIGVIDLLGKSSAVETIQELISSGVLQPMYPMKTKRTTSSSTEPSMAPTSPTTLALSPGQGQSQILHSSMSLSPCPTKRTQSPQTPINKAPKAKKGFRLAVDPLLKKPKPEPMDIEVSTPPNASSITSNSPKQKSPAAVASNPMNAGVQSPPTVLCDFCGQLFDTRKALSCHARAHLRQLGLTWSIRTSPIDLLKEVMMRGEDGKKESSASGKAMWTNQGSKGSRDSLQSGEPSTNTCASPLDYSMKEKFPSGKSRASNTDTSCELCGFDFENRKALASHARAHLRQLGIIEWKADGASSPIELLSELIRKDPAKVEAITQRYHVGDLYIKKSHRAAASPSLSMDSDFLPGSSFKTEQKASRMDLSRQSLHARTSDTHVRSSRGVQQPKHVVATGEESQDSQQPPRSSNIPALLPKPPLTPLVKLVGKVYSLKCRFCEEVFHGPLSVQEKWITHLQKHILSLGYKGKASPPAAQVTTSALVDPVAV